MIDQVWFSCGNYAIHIELFKKGLIVTSASSRINEQNEVTENAFYINDRKLKFFSGRDNLKQVQRPFQLLSKLTSLKSSQLTTSRDNLIANTKRREEIFLPLLFENQLKHKFGVYVYPWLGKDKDKQDDAFVFNGFEQFVTAGCLFGSSLQGMDQRGACQPLIKHHIEFFEGQKFVDINIDEGNQLSLYEEMLFAQFKMLASLIEQLSAPGCNKKLLYHLPYYDYILIGIELYIKGRIEKKALGMLCEHIMIRKDAHMKQIHKMASDHNIEVTITSPFENLFEDFLTKGQLKPNDQLQLADSILKMLQVPEKGNAEEREKEFVDSCIKKMVDSKFNPVHSAAWADFSRVTEPKKKESIDDLFTIANAITIGVAAKGKDKYKTCSLLPLSEKQIQVGFEQYCKKFDSQSTDMMEIRDENLYPPVFNITTLDPLITYNSATKGLPFYLSPRPEALLNAVTKKNLISCANQNVFSYVEGNQSIQLEKILECPESKFSEASSSTKLEDTTGLDDYIHTGELTKNKKVSDKLPESPRQSKKNENINQEVALSGRMVSGKSSPKVKYGSFGNSSFFNMLKPATRIIDRVAVGLGTELKSSSAFKLGLD